MFKKEFETKEERDFMIENSFSDYYLANILTDWKQGIELDAEYCTNKFNKNERYKCVYNVIYSLLKAYKEITNKYGDDNTKWKLKYESNVEYLHIPFSNKLLFKYLFHRIQPGEVFIIIKSRGMKTHY